MLIPNLPLWLTNNNNQYYISISHEKLCKKIIRRYGKFYTYVVVFNGTHNGLINLRLISNEKYYKTIGYYETYLDMINKLSNEEEKNTQSIALASQLNLNLQDLNNIYKHVKEHIYNLKYEDFEA